MFYFKYFSNHVLSISSSKILRKVLERHLRLVMSFSGRNVTINANFGSSVYITLKRNCEAEVDR